MMLDRMIFCRIIRIIILPFIPYDVKMLQIFLSRSQCKFISHDFDFFICILLCTKPAAVELSVRIVVGGCGWFIAINKCWIANTVFAFWKTPFVSASAANVTKFLIVLHSIRTAPLWMRRFCVSLFCKSLKYPSYLLRAFGITKNIQHLSPLLVPYRLHKILLLYHNMC